MKEFGFYNDFDDDLMLNESIEINANGQYLVANSEKLNASVYAPEINFYLKNTRDTVLDKAKNTLLLYEVRANVFDLAKDIDYQKDVGKNVVIVSNYGRENLVNELKKSGFNVIALTHFEIKFVYGAVGELSVIVLRANDEFEVDCDFLLVDNAREYMLRQSGCYEIFGMDDEKILKMLTEKSPKFSYKSHINYDSTICQYHERRFEICGKCSDICPTVAILKDDESKNLVFSHIDCVNCGGCVSVCPSGAIEYSHMPKDSFLEVAKMYRDKNILIIPSKMDLENLKIELPPNVLPFAIDGEKFLSETHLITLLQESGGNIVFYCGDVGRATKEAILIVNEIYKLKFNQPAIYVATNLSELKDCLKKSAQIPNSQYSLAQYAMPKREIFAKRLAWLIKDENLGFIKTYENVSYGTVEINRDTCTLCLACVGACNVSALVADNKTNSILFNPSICTACGYCEVSCAEKDTIFLHKGKIELRPEFFTYNELAHDELFACVECGKEFATKKAVEKIAQIMKSRFGGDESKIRTLYCCSDCKAKIMVMQQIKQAREEILNG
ncbi:MAG: 4Fe-4S dicluster domain-containing protein [Campylobacter sp.]